MKHDTTSKHYNVGTIGYGWAATAHIAAINATKQGRVTAVCSSRPLDAADLSAKHGGPIKVYKRVEEMLADPAIDVIDITGLPSLHRDQAVAAAKAKKHIILEKPMANSPEEVADIMQAAAANGVKSCVCFECRFSNQFQVTKALLDEGSWGNSTTARWTTTTASARGTGSFAGTRARKTAAAPCSRPVATPSTRS
jgi:UDP-N-acetyl-2-amino-2-deoxyglucuronate dehydrogenase